jgi:hypothetical protein
MTHRSKLAALAVAVPALHATPAAADTIFLTAGSVGTPTYLYGMAPATAAISSGNLLTDGVPFGLYRCAANLRSMPRR